MSDRSLHSIRTCGKKLINKCFEDTCRDIDVLTLRLTEGFRRFEIAEIKRKQQKLLPEPTASFNSTSLHIR
jgi:hypothetical protein